MLKLFYRYACFIILLFSCKAFGAQPDTLRILDIVESASEDPLELWEHILPKKHRYYTNYSLENIGEGLYLRALSSGTGSWLELDTGDLNVSKYHRMEWLWRVDQFPETEWEMHRSDDDFAIRIELVYDYKGGKINIFNLIRKGLITAFFRRWPPELIVSYVWSLNVPHEKPYQSPNSKRMMIVPVESDVALQGRWINESKNIMKDLNAFKGERSGLTLKKIRIRSDTDDVPTIAESGLKYIYLIAEGSE